ERVLFVDETTGAADLVLDPNDPGTAFAGMWDVWRKPWGLKSGGPGSGLYRTTDGGRTWEELSEHPGMPAGVLGKIGVAVSPVDSHRVYAIVEADEGGVFRSDDRGETWERVNDERKLRQRAFYYTRIYADPQEKDIVYVLNVGFFKSEDGGETFPHTIRVPHGDNHDLWIAPSDNQRMINANDGGGNVSVNGGDTWTDQDYATAQFYHVITTNDLPYHVCGAQQDNSTVCMPSSGGDYYRVAGGESGYIAPHPEHPNITYGGSYGGYLNRYDRETGVSVDVRVWPDNPMGWSAEDITERFQWTFPIVFDPHDPDILYATSQHVWKTENGGMSWERISGDLTLADPATMGPSGGPITRDQTGVETYATIFSLAPSPVEEGLIWAGSDDGLIHVTRTGGGTGSGAWADVTPPQLLEHTRISMIDASPHDACTAYVAGNRYLLGDFGVYAYRTRDCGQSWTDISGEIPDGHFMRAIREDPVRPDLLYAATEKGVWVSWDDGERWQSLSRNLPVVQVSDLVVEDHDLVIATHGRSFWIMDDIDPLRQLGDADGVADVHLFEPANPVLGVSGNLLVAYLLNEPADELEVEILDGEGTVLRSWEAERPEEEAGEEETGERSRAASPLSLDQGLHTLTWNLRLEGATGFPDMILWAASTRYGPAVPPGDYRVRLTANGHTQERPFRIERDPRLPGATQADLVEQFRFSMEIQEKVTEANEAVRLIRGIEGQIEDRVDARPDDQELASRAGSLRAKLDAVEGEIYQVRNRSNQDPLNYPIKLNNRIAALLGVVQRAPARPTAQSYEVFEILSGELATQMARLREILNEDLSGFNALLEQRGLEPVREEMIPEDA
ncbi:MAG: WD40/YVTN/BNR-like repeat-containing protein, partial [Gemmatimonadota bacterium]